jgi:antitoxin component of MazEF toxin-antitoxin module
MIKTITKVGNSAGLILDAALLDLAHLKVGDKVNVEVHESGTVSLVPLRPQVSQEEFRGELAAVMARYGRTLKKLA